MRLRTMAMTLSGTINDVENLIKDAATAVNNMSDAFSHLVNDLDHVDQELGLAFDAIQSGREFDRVAARGHVDDAEKTWILVLNLARDFAQHGQPLIQDIDAKSVAVLPSVPEIHAAAYGGVD